MDRRVRDLDRCPCRGEEAGHPSPSLFGTQFYLAIVLVEERNRETRAELDVQQVNGVPKAGLVEPFRKRRGPNNSIESAQTPLVGSGKRLDPVSWRRCLGCYYRSVFVGRVPRRLLRGSA